ncbi:MAG: hypothetical protein AAF495_17055 [Pseudomonadota bacterium]
MRAKAPHDGRTRAERGIALISVLWVLTLLAVITASFATTSRTEVNLARNLVENAEAQALAEAGVQRAIFGLLRPTQQGGLRADGALYVWAYGGGQVRFSVTDEGGKVDLNAAQEDLLSALLRALEVGRAESDDIAAAIVDFRDANNRSRALGAEDGDYLAAGLDYDAKDAPYDDVGELRQVLGISAELYEALTPLVTVYTGRRSPHGPSAPEAVRQALNLLAEEDDGDPQQGEDVVEFEPLGLSSDAAGGTDPEAAGDLSEEELQGLLETADGGPATLEEGADTAERSGSGIYRIRAEGRSERGATAALEVVVRLAGRAGPPYRVMSWRRAPLELFAQGGAPDDAAEP